mgnify:CR=1 FL=1
MARSFRVLVVDDNREFCSNVTDILELRGYEVTSAHDGQEGVEAVKGNGFDVVLLDVKMPVMNGLETYRRIKEIEPHTPVIMMSAFAVEDLIRDALREGAYGYLKKPIDFDQLFKIIQSTAGEGAMVLVADDDENLCENMRQILSDRGYRVCVVNDGNEAVEKAAKNHFDIMLLDMKLPPLNGLETYLAIRRFRPDIVTVAITGYRQEMSDLVQRAIERSVYTCVEKPIDMDRLFALLDQIEVQKRSGKIRKPEQ